MVLITGSNTLVGKALLPKLIKQNEKVRCLDFEPPENRIKGIEYITGDVLDDTVLKKAVNNISTVYHLLDIPYAQAYNRSYMKKINITGTKKILKISEQHGVKKFIFMSSHEVYGKSRIIPVRHDDPKRPASTYGKNKLKAEKECWKYAAKHNMSVAVFRPALITGAETDNPVILITLYLALAMGESNRRYITGNGDNIFQFLHPLDCAEALLSAHNAVNINGQVYNLGSNNVPPQIEQVVKLKELAMLESRIKHISSLRIKILSILLRPFKITYLNKNHLIMLNNHIFMDCQRAKRDLNWEPEYDNIDIMLEAIEWYKKQKL